MTLLDRETGRFPEGESYSEPNWHADDESEAEEVLAQYVHEGFAFSPRLRDAILTHVLRVACPEPDFELRLAAVQAIVRRMRHAKTDGVRVASRPKGRAVGEWEVGEHGGTHHGIVIESLEPLRTSCGCDETGGHARPMDRVRPARGSRTSGRCSRRSRRGHWSRGPQPSR